MAGPWRASGGGRPFEFGRRIPSPLDPKEHRRVGFLRNHVGRQRQFLNEFDVRLLMPLKIERRLAGNLLESQNYLPQSCVFWLRMCDHLVEALTRDMVKRKLRAGFQNTNVPVRLAE